MPRFAPHAGRLERTAIRGAFWLSGVLLAVLVAPLLVIVPLSLTSGTLLVFPLPGLSLQWYEELLTHPHWSSALRNSLLIALPTTAAATAFGTLAALGLWRLRGRVARLALGLLVTPLIVPVVIFAVAAFYHFAWLGLLGTYAGLVVAHTILSMPFVVITVLATLQGFDPSLIRAAGGLGATPRQVFRRVTLPIILPGVVSGALFAFIHSFDELVVTIFVAAPEQRTLPRQLWSGVQESITPTVAAAAVVLMAASVVFMLVIEALRRRSARLRGER
ncbi:ABC transporter permease [Falsiroseomonas oryzae]|uniref:ABC transporter permease n=1 Tax=Falsiroseomonas oryzae TaxID=2766473 RepID=UPI0022EA4F53|nr:ABC transporter permease [Roseomonas sp. MO-31]